MSTLAKIIAALWNWFAEHTALGRWAVKKGKWALAGRPLEFRVAQPLRPLLHMVALYPLLFLLLLFVFGLVWGGLLGEYDAFHMVWHDRWAVGLLNGVTVAFILGGLLLATHLLDRTRWPGSPGGVIGSRPHWENYWIAWWVLLLAVVLPAFGGDRFRVKFPVADGGSLVSPCDPPAMFEARRVADVPDKDFKGLCDRTWLARVWFPLGVLACGAVFSVIRLWYPQWWEAGQVQAAEGETSPADPPLRIAGWLGRHLLGGFVLMLVAHVIIGSEFLKIRDDLHLGTPPFEISPWFAVPLALLLVGLWLGAWPKERVAWQLVRAAILVGLAVVVFSLMPMPASLSVLFLIGLLTAGAWKFTQIAVLRRWWLYPALFLFFLVPFLIHNLQTTYCLPEMEVVKAGPDGKPVVEGSYYDAERRVNLIDYDHLRDRARADRAGLLDDDKVLDRWHARMRERYGRHRPVVVVAVSGGASASALYTADVLFTLELESPGLSDQIRVIGGASGGMLGAAYFVAQYRPHTPLADARRVHAAAWKKRYAEAAIGPPTDALAAADKEYADARATYCAAVRAARDKARHELGQDFLSPLVQQWVHKDLPLYYLWPLETTNDRGRALELSWKRLLGGVLDVPVKTLRAEEALAEIPSLIFTPMMIEDGRQLFISNLDLDYMVDSRIPDPTRQEYEGAPREKPSHTGMEFFRLFPDAGHFKLSTAVRLNASFPFLSPSAALPTNPERHVVDAGYYDNYGTLTGTRWITKHTDWLNNTWYKDAGEPTWTDTPAAYLIQVRCFAFETQTRQFVTQKEGQEVVRKGPGAVARTETGLFSVTAPLTGLFASWRANMVYRGDERVDAVENYIRRRDKHGQGVRVARVLFECPYEPSLNWQLTDAGRWRLAAGGGGMIETEFERVRGKYAKALDEWTGRALLAGTVANRVGAGAATGFPVLAGVKPGVGMPELAFDRTMHPEMIEDTDLMLPPGQGRSPAAGRRELFWRLLSQDANPPGEVPTVRTLTKQLDEQVRP